MAHHESLAPEIIDWFTTTMQWFTLDRAIPPCSSDSRICRYRSRLIELRAMLRTAGSTRRANPRYADTVCGDRSCRVSTQAAQASSRASSVRIALPSALIRPGYSLAISSTSAFGTSSTA